MSVSVLIDGDKAIVEPSPDELPETARKLLAAADHPWDVSVVHGRRIGFRVPAALVDALGLVQADDSQDEGTDGDDTDDKDGGEGTDAPAPPVEAPTGNASRAAWAAFLDAQGVSYGDDDGRDDLRELWANHG